MKDECGWCPRQGVLPVQRAVVGQTGAHVLRAVAVPAGCTGGGGQIRAFHAGQGP